MNYQDMSRKVQEHLLAFFHSQNDETFVYHNLGHTQSVVKAATEIANHYQLDEKDFFIVTTAAWFHDAGYSAPVLTHWDNPYGFGLVATKERQAVTPGINYGAGEKLWDQKRTLLGRLHAE